MGPYSFFYIKIKKKQKGVEKGDTQNKKDGRLFL
jgi:hypothetical protein